MKNPEVVFWLTEQPKTLRDAAEKARKKKGHNKKTAMAEMIRLYVDAK